MKSIALGLLMSLALPALAAVIHPPPSAPSALAQAPLAKAVANQSQQDWFGEIQPPTQVTEKIWRSGRPTETTLTALYAKGVRVIINLENDQAKIDAEEFLAKRIGFIYFSYPTDSFWYPDDEKMNQILGILRSSSVPVLVHCYHGEDRTGLVIGLERVLDEKWPAGKAYDEMLNHGFHRILLGLDQFFHDKVGAF